MITLFSLRGNYSIRWSNLPESTLYAPIINFVIHVYTLDLINIKFNTCIVSKKHVLKFCQIISYKTYPHIVICKHLSTRRYHFCIIPIGYKLWSNIIAKKWITFVKRKNPNKYWYEYRHILKLKNNTIKRINDYKYWIYIVK